MVRGLGHRARPAGMIHMSGCRGIIPDRARSLCPIGYLINKKDLCDGVLLNFIIPITERGWAFRMVLRKGAHRPVRM